MPELDSQVTNKMTAVAEIRETQLNEKISETTYQIIHPETNANQVITNTLKRFVSDADKARWNATAENNTASLQYRGQWTTGTTYKKYDVVYVTFDDVSLSGSSTTRSYTHFYIFINDTPTVSTSTNGPLRSTLISRSSWVNIDFTAYLANRTDTVKVDNNSTYGSDVLIAFVPKGTDEYKTLSYDSQFTYNPSTNTFKVQNIQSTDITATTVHASLDGEADRAVNYVTYERDSAGNKIEGGKKGKAEIDSTIVGLKKRIDAITDGSGGAVLGNKLTITKDGENGIEFDGSQPVSVDIKQTYTPEEISDLLDEQKKIYAKWLPDSILGQLRYIGVWNPNTQNSGVTASKGDYYIATGSGNYAPDGTLMNTSASAMPHYFQTGDWAVYNGSTWDKVDNTDAVTMVNNRIGAVETYQVWTAGSTYYRGDIIKVDGVLYICNTQHKAATSFDDVTTKDYWDVFGRNYSAADGIKIEDNVIKHSTSAPTVTESEATLSSGQSFNVPSINTDSFGHITTIDVKKIELGTDFIDTVRPIRVGENVVLDAKTKDALVFKGSTWINLDYSSNALNIEHKNNGTLGSKDFTTEKVTASEDNENILYAGQGFKIPKFSIDGAGHVVTGEMVTYRLSDAFIKHNHFNVATDSDGASIIKAYDSFTSDELNDSNNALKFYLGNTNPVNTSQMNFNGIFNATKLLQAGRKLIDASTKLFNGTSYTGTELLGSYNETANRFEAPDTGVAPGVYSAVSVNSKGIVNAAGHMIEFGTEVDADPSDSLVIGGLFFRLHSTNDKNA